MDDKELERAFRNGWVLTAISLVFVVVFCWLVFVTNMSDPEVEWDMGGEPFVPASHEMAEGYYLPVEQGGEAKK